MRKSLTRTVTRYSLVLIAICAILLVVSGCSETARQAYLVQDAERAKVVGFDNIRMTLDESRDDPHGDRRAWMPARSSGHINILMISGGGAGGAFGVGVLSAWTKKGDRPQFDVVTGVSTGALIAPFAFLGSDADRELVRLYTSGQARDLVEMRWMGTGLFGASLLKSEPLRAMVEHSMTREMLARIAAEHRKGRRLLVLTTNLDTQKAVVWNMGAIADSGRPEALQLFRSILIASASVPGVYPAVMIKVRSDGRDFEEMHSDGGSASQVLTLPDGLIADATKFEPRGNSGVNIYVIVNNALRAEFDTTENKTLPVIARAYSIMIKSQTKSALLALHGYAKRTGAHFHVASIDRQVAYSMSDPFNTSYMRSVFTLGYSEMLRGEVWKDTPLFR